ncbi:MAG: hypothetical protein LBB73_07125, partial [Dysgonamonadaceae bacterium]|nr:hypothetical protein [Dysgonamonadaceae bacterium]
MAITITPEELKKSAVKYRKQLLLMLTTGLEASLKHGPPPGRPVQGNRRGVRRKRRTGAYSPSRKNTSTGIKGRTLEVFLGSVIKEFDPNDVWQSIHGGLLLHGEGLKNVEITKAIPAAEVKSISRKLNAALFSAVRDGSGTTGAALFDGFDT